MNFDDILSAIDRITGAPERNQTHTFTVSAPLCVPIRHLWTALHKVGIRGTFAVMPSLTTHQSARLTVSRKQSEYTSLLLWKQAASGADWPEGLDIKNDPHRAKSRAAVIRNGHKMPKPWADSGKEWRQAGCKTRR